MTRRGVSVLDSLKLGLCGPVHSAAVLAGDLLHELGASVVTVAVPAEWTGLDGVILDGEAYRVLSRDNDLRALAERPGGPIILVVSDFGLTGPLRDAAVSEFVLQALSGLLGTNGYAGEGPMQIGVPIGRAGAAMLGAAGMLAGLMGRDRSGQGQLVDVAGYDVLVNFLGTLLPTVLLTGRPFVPIGNRHAMTAPWNSYPTTDGWVIVTTMGDAQWAGVLRAIGRDDLASAPDFADADSRVRHVDAVDELISAWTRGRSTTDAIELLQRNGVPAGRINDIDQVMEDEAVLRRGLVRQIDGRWFSRGLFKVGEGCSDDKSKRHPRIRSDEHRAPPLPLEGVRVVEFASLTAGPLVGRFLAQLGAEVVKVESPSGERSRHLAQRIGGTGYLYFINNTGKLGVCLNLDQPNDRESMRELLRSSDVFITNLATDTLAGLGLSAADVAAIAPDTVYGAITGYGVDDESGRRAFDMIVQAESGVMHLTGRPDGPPLKASLSIIDLFTACSALVATLACLLGGRANIGRQGHLVDAAMLDVGVWLSSLRWDGCSQGSAPYRLGNDGEFGDLQGLFPSADGLLVAVSTSSATVLMDLLGIETSTPPPYEVGSEILAAWVESQPAAAAVATLTERSISAGVVQSLADVVEAEQTTARQLIHRHAHASGQEITVLGSPFKFSATPVPPPAPAPELGGSNELLLPTRPAGHCPPSTRNRTPQKGASRGLRPAL